MPLPPLKCHCLAQAAISSVSCLRVYVDPDAGLLCNLGTSMGMQQPLALDLSWYTLEQPWKPMGSISVNSAAELYLAVHKAAAARGVDLTLDKAGQYIELHRACGRGMRGFVALAVTVPWTYRREE